MPELKAIVFDLDDTLVSELQFARSGFKAVAEAFTELLGTPVEIVEKMEQLLVQGHRGKVFNALLDSLNLPSASNLIEKMVYTYRTHRPSLSLYRDADELLTTIHGQYALGLISDGPLIMQQNKVDVLGLSERIQEILLTDSLGPGFGKPHPRAFELMSQRLGVRSSECLYVADNAAKDFVAPNELGWKTVQITRPDGLYRLVTSPPGGQPDRVISSLDEVLETRN